MNINLKDLTQEQIADLRNQLAELDKPSHFTDIKSWDDAYYKIKPLWFIDSLGDIDCSTSIYGKAIYCNDHIPSELHAKSILASCKLMVIAEALNEGWKPDWSDINQSKFEIIICIKNLEINVRYYSNSFQISFKSREIAEYCAEQFKDLWMDYFMINESANTKN